MVAALSPANTATVTSGGSCFGLRVIPNFIFWRDSSCGAAVSAMVFIGVHCPEERSRHPVVSRVCGLISSLAALIPRLRWGLCLLCGPLRLLHRRCGRCCGLDRNHRARVLCCWRTCLNRLCRRLLGRWRVCLRRWRLVSASALQGCWADLAADLWQLVHPSHPGGRVLPSRQSPAWAHSSGAGLGAPLGKRAERMARPLSGRYVPKPSRLHPK